MAPVLPYPCPEIDRLSREDHAVSSDYPWRGHTAALSELLLSDAEFAKNTIKQRLDTNLARNPAQGPQGQTQRFGP